MLHLTRIQLPYEIAAKRRFGDPYAWHQATWEAFSHLGKDASREFLFRTDQKDDHIQILLLSGQEPQRPDWCPEPEWAVKPIDSDFFEHRRFHFSLLANPTRKVRSDRNGNLLKNSRRVAITHREDSQNDEGKPQRGLLTWIEDKGAAAGFRLPEPEDIKTAFRPTERLQSKKQSSTGVLHGVDFQGVLEVTDADALQAAMAAGIGPARAFGFGLLCLSPLSSS